MNKVFVFLILTTLSFGVRSQNPVLTLTAPKQVAPGDPFRVECTINVQGADINRPDFSGFEFYGESTSNMVSVTNGNMTIKESRIYTISIANEGSYKIGPVTAEVNGKTITSNTVTIKVDKSVQSATQNDPWAQFFGFGQQPNQQRQNPVSEDKSVEANGRDVFINLNFNKKEVYVGEQIILTSALYSRYDVYDLGDAKFPSFTGFWAVDISNPANITFNKTKINNKLYLCAPWQKKALFPQYSGDLTINPYQITCLIGDSWGFQRQKIVARSSAVKIKVKPLPDGKPKNFGGAVGKFAIDISADKTSVNLDDPLTLKITVSGRGNFQLFEAPKPDFPSALESFAPKTIDGFKAGIDGVSGKKAFTYVVIARQSGKFVIPATEFSYFDPSTQKYSTISTNPLEINITGTRDSTAAAAAVYSGFVGEDIQNLGSDIRYIDTDNFKLIKDKSVFFNSLEFWLIFVLIPVLLVTVLILRSQQIKNNADIRAVKNRKAGKTSKKRLLKASQYMKLQKKDEFYVEILNALWGYLGDKLSINAAELSRDYVCEKLSGSGVSQNSISDLVELLNDCEFERYAPLSASDSLNQIYDRSANVIEQLESEIKKA